MNAFIVASFAGTVYGLLMTFLSLFLILLVLVQRGRGGGLAGALGGPGGQSAFGSKAGDTFTMITVVVASIWGLTCALAMLQLGQHSAPKKTANKDKQTQSAIESTDAEGTSTPGLKILKGTGESGVGGLGGGLSSGTGETPSMDLTPAGDSDAADGDATDSDGEEPESSVDTPKPDASQESGESQASEGDSDDDSDPSEADPKGDEPATNESTDKNASESAASDSDTTEGE